MLSRKLISSSSREVLDRTIRVCMPLRPRMEVCTVGTINAMPILFVSHVISVKTGLAARLLLQPLEENARLLFSRQGALVAHGNVAGDKGDTKDARGYTSNLLQDLEDSYFFFVRVVLYIGFLFAAIGSNYSSVLLRLLAGSRWGSNPEATAALSAL